VEFSGDRTGPAVERDFVGASVVLAEAAGCQGRRPMICRLTIGRETICGEWICKQTRESEEIG
jgi:hypothetical protein